MAEVDTTEKVAEFIFGNFHDESIHFPDLTSGPRDSTRAFRMEPGQVLDLEDFFSAAKLRRSHSLKQAVTEGWLKPVKDANVAMEAKTRKFESGEAPRNAFDDRLADLLDKEDEEEERLKSGRDPLRARANRGREK